MLQLLPLWQRTELSQAKTTNKQTLAWPSTHLALEAAALNAFPLAFHAWFLPPHADVTATTIFSYLAGLTHTTLKALKRGEGEEERQMETILSLKQTQTAGEKRTQRSRARNRKGTKGGTSAEQPVPS